MAEDEVAALAIVCIFGLPIIGWIAMRAMQHRERMEMIKRGIPPSGVNMPGSWGRPAGPGPAATTRFDPGAGLDAQRALRKGIVLAFVGLAITIGLSFIDPFHPGPWLLGGLIPLFIGVAQVIIALMAGATIAVTPHTRPGIGSQAPGPSVPPPSNFEGPYTYRPDATPELQRPAQPPDRR